MMRVWFVNKYINPGETGVSVEIWCTADFQWTDLYDYYIEVNITKQNDTYSSISMSNPQFGRSATEEDANYVFYGIPYLFDTIRNSATQVIFSAAGYSEKTLDPGQNYLLAKLKIDNSSPVPSHATGAAFTLAINAFGSGFFWNRAPSSIAYLDGTIGVNNPHTAPVLGRPMKGGFGF